MVSSTRRYSWRTWLASGKSIRWVADQLGHADPAFTLRTYAHALREEEIDLSFADYDGPGRPYAAPLQENENQEPRNTAERHGTPGGIRRSLALATESTSAKPA